MTLQDTFEYENGFSPFQLVGTFVVPLTHTNTHISSGSILQSFHLLRSIFNSDTFHFLFGACLCYFFWRRSFKYWITGGGGWEKVESDFGLIAIVVFVGAQQIANVKDCHIYYVYSFVIDASFVV